MVLYKNALLLLLSLNAFSELIIPLPVCPQHAHNAGKLQQLSNKIDTDIANLKTVFEQYRNDVLKYAGGKMHIFIICFVKTKNKGHCCKHKTNLGVCWP